MKIKIIFGTQMGTTKYVATVFQKKLTELGHQVDLFQVMEDQGQPDLTGCDLLLIGSPTYEQGQLVYGFEDFLSSFSPDLSQVPVAIFSLGDKTFSHFCASAEALEAWVVQHQGHLKTEPLKINGYPHDAQPLIDWVSNVVAKPGA